MTSSMMGTTCWKMTFALAFFPLAEHFLHQWQNRIDRCLTVGNLAFQSGYAFSQTLCVPSQTRYVSPQVGQFFFGNVLGNLRHRFLLNFRDSSEGGGGRGRLRAIARRRSLFFQLSQKRVATDRVVRTEKGLDRSVRPAVPDLRSSRFREIAWRSGWESFERKERTDFVRSAACHFRSLHPHSPRSQTRARLASHSMEPRRHALRSMAAVSMAAVRIRCWHRPASRTTPPVPAPNQPHRPSFLREKKRAAGNNLLISRTNS